MAAIDRPDPVILGHLLSEHRELFGLIQSVRMGLSSPQQPPPGDRESVVGSLRSLRSHLHDHFAQEEAGGFLEEAVTRVPRLSPAMRSILGAHPALLAELDGLIERLAADHTQTAWESAAAAFEAFAEHMKAHERQENSVVQQGYNEDLGLVE